MMNAFWQSQQVRVENPATWRSPGAMTKEAGGQRTGGRAEESKADDSPGVLHEGGRETGLGGEITLCVCVAENSSGEKLGEGGKNGACCSK